MAYLLTVPLLVPTFVFFAMCFFVVFQVECCKVEGLFYERVHALECEFAEKFKPLFEKVRQMPWGILQWTCICFKEKSSKIVITPFAENSLQGHPFILFFFQFCQNIFFFFFFFFHVDTLLILVLWEYCLTSPIKYTSSHLNLLTPRSVLHLNFLLTISLLNQIPRS